MGDGPDGAIGKLTFVNRIVTTTRGSQRFWVAKSPASASQQLLVFKGVYCFAVQAIGILIDDLDVATITFLALEGSNVGARRTLQPG
jgi:hypothetical protein